MKSQHERHICQSFEDKILVDTQVMDGILLGPAITVCGVTSLGLLRVAGQLALPWSSATNPVWKIVWKLKILSKVKKIVWCALHGILPLKSILINRHIGDSNECPLCQLDAEDILHLLFKC
jgi:hypothetical protein